MCVCVVIYNHTEDINISILIWFVLGMCSLLLVGTVVSWVLF